MTNVEELREKELESLSKQEHDTDEEEIFDLETLITDGEDARIPVIVKFPKNGKTVKAAALIRPLTNVEWNNCVRIKRKPSENTTNEVEVLKKALYTKDGKQFPPKIIENMPAGVALELMNEVSRISGIDTEKNMKMAKDMVGFLI